MSAWQNATNITVVSPTPVFQASLAALLGEKWKLESRVVELERQLGEAQAAVRVGDDAATAAAAAVGEKAVIDQVDASLEYPTPPVTPRQPSTAAAEAVAAAFNEGKRRWGF